MSLIYSGHGRPHKVNPGSKLPRVTAMAELWFSLRSEHNIKCVKNIIKNVLNTKAVDCRRHFSGALQYLVYVCKSHIQFYDIFKQ